MRERERESRQRNLSETSGTRRQWKGGKFLKEERFESEEKATKMEGKKGEGKDIKGWQTRRQSTGGAGSSKSTLDGIWGKKRKERDEKGETKDEEERSAAFKISAKMVRSPEGTKKVERRESVIDAVGLERVIRELMGEIRGMKEEMREEREERRRVEEEWRSERRKCEEEMKEEKIRRDKIEKKLERMEEREGKMEMAIEKVERWRREKEKKGFKGTAGEEEAEENKKRIRRLEIKQDRKEREERRNNVVIRESR